MTLLPNVMSLVDLIAPCPTLRGGQSAEKEAKNPVAELTGLVFMISVNLPEEADKTRFVFGL